MSDGVKCGPGKKMESSCAGIASKREVQHSGTNGQRTRLEKNRVNDSATNWVNARAKNG